MARGPVSPGLDPLALLPVWSRLPRDSHRRKRGRLCSFTADRRRPLPTGGGPAGRAAAPQRIRRAFPDRLRAASSGTARAVSARVLVTDGEQRAALAVVRSLGRAGYTCLVAESRPPSLAGASRYAAARIRVPDALQEPAQFEDAIARFTRDRDVDVVLPITDASVLAVLGVRDRLGRAVVPFPTLEAFRRISDKQVVHAEAGCVGLAAPAQFPLPTPWAVAVFDPKALAFPVGLKPFRSTVEVRGQLTKLGVSYASNERELRARVAALPPEAFPLLLQQRILGHGIGIFQLLWDGKLVATFAHRRL